MFIAYRGPNTIFYFLDRNVNLFSDLDSLLTPFIN